VVWLVVTSQNRGAHGIACQVAAAGSTAVGGMQGHVGYVVAFCTNFMLAACVMVKKIKMRQYINQSMLHL
jgi:hypothetical protein